MSVFHRGFQKRENCIKYEAVGLELLFFSSLLCFTGVAKHSKTITISSLFSSLETPVKHEAQVFEMASKSAPKQRILFM